ncbi:amino acid permease-domain-containing protein [Mycena metata]|uniref:Amino acid permease-domain-containing protein n=1 Tax=Mycena metata TaxID=1033252 RepID=A0AAD7MNE6_9AGAR|nr:amino acid permease-domain-containing protein [Mycena metata]
MVKTEMKGLEPEVTSDNALLASLGYKQELKRAFTPIELFGFGFSVSAIAPSVASVLVYSLPNGGSSAMIWGWAVSTVFLMFIAMAMAELGSSAPTSGGLYYWTYKFASPRFRNVLCWMVGYTNTISYITGVAGVDWSCATLIMAGVTIGSDGRFIPTVHQTFGVYCAVLASHGLVASCATKVIARLQYLFITINIALILVLRTSKNDAKYTFGNFTNLTPWPNGYAFILSFLAPLWTVGGFDVGVHISEEALNANVAVCRSRVAFCMGPDTVSILSSPIQQPFATILLNSVGKHGMLAIWSFIFIALYMAGVSLLTSSSRPDIRVFTRRCFAVFQIPLQNQLVYGYPRFDAFGFRHLCGTLGAYHFRGPAAAGALFTLGVIGQYVANSIPITTRWLGGQPFKKGPFSLGAFSLPVAIVAVLWMWFMTIVLLFPSFPDPNAETMNYSVVVLFGVLFLALAYYYLPYYGGRHWFKGPVSNH